MAAAFNDPLFGAAPGSWYTGSGAWHQAEIDYLHIPDEGPQHWAHGAYFGHSEHDEPGNTKPNRNFNSPSVALLFDVPDLMLAYFHTDERHHRSAVRR